MCCFEICELSYRQTDKQTYRYTGRKPFVRTVDSDIVVLATAFFDRLGLSELWIGFGTGKHYRDIAIHIIHAELGTSRSRALPLFHALTAQYFER